jgi:DNA (cytosine-5)-methyltransferase 1
VAIHPGHEPALAGLALCAGVGGLELGLHIAEPRYRTVCFVEREAFAASTLVARMADQALDHAPVWDDVKAFDGRPWRGKVSLITGGYPCQPFSFAGPQRGKKDPRHLWPDIARIVREIDPEWCFFENVEGHLSVGATEVFKDLRLMGFSVKAGLFSALEVGASHLRRRLFILAHADHYDLHQQGGTGDLDSRNEIEGRPDTDRLSDLDRQGGPALDLDVVAGAELGRPAGGQSDVPLFAPAPFEVGAWRKILERRPDLQPELLGLADGLATGMDRPRAAGNGVVSLAAAHAWRTLKAEHFGAGP